MPLSALLLSIAVAAAASQPRAPAAETEADRVVRLTRELERMPLARDAEAQRQWLTQWLVDTPHFTVVLCEIWPLPPPEQPYVPELVGQQMFGNVAFQITHPDTRDAVTLQVAGLESLLLAYRAILAERPGARIPQVDELVEQQRAGRLRESVAPRILEACTGKDETKPAPAADEPDGSI